MRFAAPLTSTGQNPDGRMESDFLWSKRSDARSGDVFFSIFWDSAAPGARVPLSRFTRKRTKADLPDPYGPVMLQALGPGAPVSSSMDSPEKISTDRSKHVASNRRWILDVTLKAHGARVARSNRHNFVQLHVNLR